MVQSSSKSLHVFLHLECMRVYILISKFSKRFFTIFFFKYKEFVQMSLLHHIIIIKCFGIVVSQYILQAITTWFQFGRQFRSFFFFQNNYAILYQNCITAYYFLENNKIDYATLHSFHFKIL